MWEFIHALNTAYKVPNRQRIAEELLPQCYKLFWQHCKSISPLLGQFAHRIFSTPANSVPSERSFSAMNYIINKFRTSMEMERGNQATYIYMNSRELRRAKKSANG